MCGRYSLVPSESQWLDMATVAPLTFERPARYNASPTQPMPVVLQQGDDKVWQTLQWGLVPAWSEDGKNTGKMINARAETIAEKPSFRQALRKRRCLVPADSFYEWRAGGNGAKIPHRIFAEDGSLLWMAGIWETWAKNGEEKHTFSIVTTDPNREMSAVHNRMPVLLTDDGQRAQWMEGSVEAALACLHSARDGYLEMYPVSTALNRAGFESPELHLPQA